MKGSDPAKHKAAQISACDSHLVLLLPTDTCLALNSGLWGLDGLRAVLPKHSLYPMEIAPPLNCSGPTLGYFSPIPHDTSTSYMWHLTICASLSHAPASPSARFLCPLLLDE